MKNLGWHDAIFKILQQSGSAMNYTDIAEEVVKQGLRRSVGATPASTVNAYINRSINEDADKSPYVRVDRGVYLLREKPAEGMTTKGKKEPDKIIEDDDSIIQALGMFWQRDLVHWSKKPKILGRQQIGATPVDFCNQIGVYLLHDRREVLYVGRIIDRPLGTRLFEHTQDRMRGRWDRFSWFGIKNVSEKGQLTDSNKTITINAVIAAFEAILIEGLEPRQNRKRGDSFNAVEYLQAEDPEIESQRKKRLLTEIGSKL